MDKKISNITSVRINIFSKKKNTPNIQPKKLSKTL